MQIIDALINKADSGADASDSAKRWKDYQDAEKLLVDTDPAVIPLYQTWWRYDDQYEGHRH
jgi:ABC-type transport system substrate-binding protein